VNDWYPLRTRTLWCAAPPPGAVIALHHAAWTVEQVTPLDLDPHDRDQWLAEHMPNLDTWTLRPVRLDLRHLGGARPSKAGDGWAGVATITIRARHGYEPRTWHLYGDGRWPQCSCCGEPMPCRAEMEDRQVTASLNRIETLTSRLPGCCWACGDPTTRRQDTVTYPGDNLDLPGTPGPTFHTRRACYSAAHSYEERWLAADPRRERTLTWPTCGGWLIVHADGTSECRTEHAPLSGQRYESQPDCQGHLTHDHRGASMCLADGPCPRGCRREDHRGTGAARRPPRHPNTRQPTLPTQ
jgi:hypothetical protein